MQNGKYSALGSRVINVLWILFPAVGDTAQLSRRRLWVVFPCNKLWAVENEQRPAMIGKE